MAVDQLWLYNEALRVIGERKLISTTEAQPTRYLLDGVYYGTFFDTVLEEGEWAFATRTSRFDYSPSVEPPFGFRYAFNKPTDWLKTTAMCCDEYFLTPLNGMADENGFWFSDLQTIYVKYISNDDAYGKDLSKWPPSFSAYAGAYLGRKIVPRVKNAKIDVDEVEAEMQRALIKARSKDVMNGPTKFPPVGSFVAARLGRGNPRRSLWNGGGFTGG